MTTKSSDRRHLKNSAIRSYDRANVVVVHKTKERFGGLSNMASGYPLKVNDVWISTSEALYQSCRFPHIPDIQKHIILQHSPMTAKMVGKPYRSQSRADWDDVRHRIMRWCLRVKLAQNFDTFGQLLLETQNFPIVEQSTKDDFWGAKSTGALDETLVGQNILGRLLMELRDLLKSQPINELKFVPPLTIPHFNLLGKPIEPVTPYQTIRKTSGQDRLF